MDGEASALRRWCILRTSGGKTLALARSLSAGGIEAWTPTRTVKRPKGPKRVKPGTRRPMVEIEMPILPTFVFAREAHVETLAALATDERSRHPAFSVFTHAGRAPLIGERSITGLREAERVAAELIAVAREHETKEEQRRARAALLRTERERRKALRTERREFTIGQRVTVPDARALSGMTGIVQASDGTSALVAFGGSLTMTIEAWRLLPNDLQAG
ncbi:hypothetical protein Q5H94_13980 [Sphingomonas sp. CA1-15]|uniref:NusG-like N-terminal domain-containing protein n=2 Tax=Sphingomonas immobilis TaxID=3063997 RepID=A0ABT9A2H1_9SPHN|nr:hypothetical protein [Sphingomonas sp. CA1-15]